MSSIITSILGSTVGLLWNKARDSTADKLKDGDITDARLREIVVRELDDIKTKLDGLSRKDLLSSYSFLEEGVGLLNVSLDKSKNEKKAVLNEAQDGRGETSRIPSCVSKSGILNEALQLSNAMGKLKINSDKEFETAKERFKDARKTATHAFCNEALSIKDRIFAAKLRIVSEILECLDNPETAITGCLLFLKKLHGLPAIREMFSVYLNGGVKSLLNKAERVDNVKSVMLINYVLFKFVSKFSPEFPTPLVWPTTIELSDRTFNPIFHWQEISTRKSMGEALTQTPNDNELILDQVVNPDHSAVNSHGEIVVRYCGDIKVISKTGESKVVKLPDLRDGEVIKLQDVQGQRLDFDKNNNVYVVKWIKTRTKNGDVESHVLYVLDENYNVKHDCRLDFFETTDRYSVKIAVNKNNDIILIKHDDPHVYVCDDTGQLKHKFERDSRSARSLGITDKNEIMTPSDDAKTVLIYTEEGDMKSSIKVPEGHVVMSVAFHHVISKIIVLSYFREQDSYFLLCFSETGELETSTFVCESDEYCPDITSHPGGPVAVVRKKRITFI